MSQVQGAGLPVLDRSVPALVVKIGHYPTHHGGVGAIRSLGRLGVPVYAVTEGHWTAAAQSRYLRDRFVWPTTGLEDPGWLVQCLVKIGRRIGRPSVLLPFDDEAAVLIAENAAELGQVFLFPRIEPSLPRQLASKRGLFKTCIRYGVSTPPAAFPSNRSELERFIADASFPVVAKDLEAFERKRAPVVTTSTRFDNADQLRLAACSWGDEFSVILQDYLPAEYCEDWIFHAYFDESSKPLVQYTGIKVRSFPLEAGMTSRAYSVFNPLLADLSAQLASSVGYRGVLDLDWRYDRRTGRYHLLDFNPRIGAQFRLFENTAKIDVVRAMHLDLTGRPVPAAPQVDGRRYLVENLDLAAALTARRVALPTPVTPCSTELAWLAADDLRPAGIMLAGVVSRAVARQLRRFRVGRGNRRTRNRPDRSAIGNQLHPGKHSLATAGGHGHNAYETAAFLPNRCPQRLSWKHDSSESGPEGANPGGVTIQQVIDQGFTRHPIGAQPVQDRSGKTCGRGESGI